MKYPPLSSAAIRAAFRSPSRGGRVRATSVKTRDGGGDIEFYLSFGRPDTMASILFVREAQGVQTLSVLRAVFSAGSPGRFQTESLSAGGLPESSKVLGPASVDRT